MKEILHHIDIILSKHYTFSEMYDKLWKLIAYHHENPDAQDLLFELIELLFETEFYELRKKLIKLINTYTP